MASGYVGKLLFVNLSTGEVKEEIPDESLYRDFIGGYGVGARILYSWQRGGVDTLGLDNTLGLVTGPLTGTPATFGCRYAVVAKSPLTSGWYRTGDLGYKDEEGYIYLTGRGDDVIVRGGENIGPDEVESVLSTHPKIEEVAVIGVKDEEWGQQVRAIVRLKKGEKATEQEIIDFCRSRLAGFKRPTSIVLVTEELPKTTTGKILRRKLREKYGES